MATSSRARAWLTFVLTAAVMAAQVPTVALGRANEVAVGEVLQLPLEAADRFVAAIESGAFLARVLP